MTQIIEQLQAKIDELEEENARLRTVPMKYRRMQFNAQLQDENQELRAQLAAAQEECEFQRNAHKQAEELMLEQSNQLAAAQEENGRLENQVLARDAELWGRTQEILGLKEQLAAEQLNNKLLRDALQEYIDEHEEDSMPVEIIDRLTRQRDLAVEALEYHQQQTRPIAKTQEALDFLRK